MDDGIQGHIDVLLERGKYEARSSLAMNNEDTIPADTAPNVVRWTRSECS